ncbi:MAG: GGDEF domain-containing protein [Methylobacteriaceae bacterium]|nr:GGDEF domain-containing protein [Methylobacteriaceae bacterium]
MRTLDLKSWFGWCALAGFGVVLPMLISNNPEFETTVRVLRALGAAGFVIALVALFRSSGEVIAPDDAVYAPPPPAPRTLAANPLAIDEADKPLAERLDAAIEASTEYDCKAGVIYYHLDTYREIARTQGVAAAEAAMDFVAGMLQIVLRDSDKIERVERGRFVVCVVLLKDRQVLLDVARRIRKAMRNMRLEALRGAPIVYDEGVALYPVQGADGAALIARARTECDAAHGRRIREIARVRRAVAERRSAA